REEVDRPGDKPEGSPASPRAQKVKIEKSPVSGRAPEIRSKAPERPAVEGGPPGPKKVRTRTKVDERGAADKPEKRPGREEGKEKDKDRGKDKDKDRDNDNDRNDKKPRD